MSSSSTQVELGCAALMTSFYCRDVLADSLSMLAAQLHETERYESQHECKKYVNCYIPVLCTPREIHQTVQNSWANNAWLQMPMSFPKSNLMLFSLNRLEQFLDVRRTKTPPFMYPH
jgi:hypothetical protein